MHEYAGCQYASFRERICETPNWELWRLFIARFGCCRVRAWTSNKTKDVALLCLAVRPFENVKRCKTQKTRRSRCSKATSWQPDKPSSRNGHKPRNKVYHVFRREERNQRDSLVVKQWKCEERLSDLSWSDWSAINSVFIWLRKVFQLQVCCGGTTQDLQGEGGHQTWQQVFLPWMNCF